MISKKRLKRYTSSASDFVILNPTHEKKKPKAKPGKPAKNEPTKR